MNLWKTKSVVPDPKAKGAIQLLNAGNGGFSVDAAPDPQKQMAAAKPAPSSPVYFWEDEDGGKHITTAPPPKGARNVSAR
jgi:hypothetical protein